MIKVSHFLFPQVVSSSAQSQWKSEHCRLIHLFEIKLDNGSTQGGEEGPFRFDCDALEVQLSPLSRQREAGDVASNATLEAILTEVRTTKMWGCSNAGLS